SLLDLNRKFDVRAVLFDPYQMQASAQRLRGRGVPMREFPQSIPNLTEASQNLYELIRSRNLIVYPDADLRLAVSRAVAIEGSRGWKIAKEKASHKIDVVVALGMAALAASQQGARPIARIGLGSWGGSASYIGGDDDDVAWDIARANVANGS